MKKAVLLFLALITAVFFAYGKEEKRLEVFFTGDIHSSGDYLALYGKIEAERAAARKAGLPFIALDAGDIAMGSVFHTLYSSSAFELTALSKMGYDAFTAGNHDFDFGPSGWLKMLAVADSINSPSGKLCRLTVANISFADPIQDSLFRIHNSEYLIFEREGVKIAVFGLLGEDAFSCIADNGFLVREDAADAARRVCDKLLSLERPDYIIALSHSGTMWADGRRIEAGAKNERKLRAKSEDGALATAVPEIDVIVSGHDHEALFSPLIVNNTVIVASGYGSQYSGKLLLEGDSVAFYALSPTGKCETYPEENTEFAMWLDSSRAQVSHLFRQHDGLGIFDTVTVLGHDLEPARHIAESYAMAAEKLIGEKPVAVVPYGMVRGRMCAGAQTYSDVFKVLPLGKADDGSYGTPLVYAYVRGKDIKDLCELNASVAGSGMEDEHLFFAGVNYTWNRHGIPFTKVADVWVYGRKLDRNALYPMVADLYTASLMGIIKSSSMGLLSVTPLDSAGNKSPFKVLPVKGWKAFAEYLKEGNGENVPDLNGQEENSMAPLLLFVTAIVVVSAVLLLLSGRLRHSHRS